MKLEGIHHVTCITGDILKNVDFYTRILGLRLVAKSVNQDDPSVYHVFYSDEQGAPGADLTFFEYKHAARGRPGRAATCARGPGCATMSCRPCSRPPRACPGSPRISRT